MQKKVGNDTCVILNGAEKKRGEETSTRKGEGLRHTKPKGSV